MRVELMKQPKKYLQSVDEATHRKLMKGIDSIISASGNIIKLKGSKYTYRYKMAHYRIIYEWRQESDLITITEINTRTNIKY